MSEKSLNNSREEVRETFMSFFHDDCTMERSTAAILTLATVIHHTRNSSDNKEET